ncbi:MAG TPA: thiamine pyrophosphate-requiring protein [Candidatus Binatia bacterium]|jgi:acetolactate synthase-1/2/3 large subunit
MERPGPHSATFDASWGSYDAEQWSDAIVAAMKLGGVENLYFVSGSEIGFFQESIARAREANRPAPRLVTVTHEAVALNAALGETMVSGRPAATVTHVDVGTLSYGGGIHNAWRGSYPVLMLGGTGPRGYPGAMPGSKNNAVQWVQEPRDQGEILRQYTKMDHRLEHQDNPGLMISRLLQVAMSEPKGPVYLTIPRETAMLKLPGKTFFPTRDELGVARPAWPDPSDARRAAEWLIQATNPCIYTGQSGRDPESVEALVRLAELLALPVMDVGRVDRLNFPMSHFLYGTGPQPKDADALLIMQTPVPFIPPQGCPKSGAKIVWVDVDPVQSRYKTMEFRADLWLPVSVAGAARAIYDAATAMLTRSDMSRIEERRARLENRKRELIAALNAQAAKARARNPLHPRWLAHEVGRILEPDAILLNDAVSSSPDLQRYGRRDQPGTYFKSGGSSGGWGAGAAFGAKLAKPDRDVVLATGDGFFMFGTPLPALWCASHYHAPFLTVIFVNRSYVTGTVDVKETYPDGAAVRAGNFEGGLFDPAPDFTKLAEAVNGYGETVSESEQVGPALERGLRHVRNGSPAIIAVQLPTTLAEVELG